MRLLTNRNVAPASRRLLIGGLQRLPTLSGQPISIIFRPQLTVCGGSLLSGSPTKGTAVHAAAFIRKRQVVLETSLLRRPRKLLLIWLHELFHFVWARLGNTVRREFSALLRNEFEHGAKGELGESSERRKQLMGKNKATITGVPWRDYVCESFCDTAAWFYAGEPKTSELTLANRWRNKRRRWLLATFSQPRHC